MSNVETVQDFLSALERLDIDEALKFCSADIVYQNVPFPPARGIVAFEKQMRGMARYGTGFQAQIHNIAGDGSVVLTERTDVLEVGSFAPSFWVCGTFEVHDGRITLWRDRFDHADVLVAVVRGAARAAMSGVLRFTSSVNWQPGK